MLRASPRRLNCSLFAVLVCVCVPSSAVQPGDIVKDVDGLAVAPNPGSAPQTILHGSPALVLAVRKDASGHDWTRLLAAGGASGWTSRQFSDAVPARFATAGPLELSDRSPDQPSISEGIETVSVPGEGARIVGASQKSRVSSPRQLLLPPHLNPFLTPWLEIRSGGQNGWIVPSEASLVWGEPVRANELPSAMDALGLNGIVRPPFLGPVQQALLASYHPGASVVRFENISSKPVRAASPDTTIKTLDSLIRVPPTWAAAFSGSRGFVLSFANLGTALVCEGTPVVARAAAADLNGDARPELVLQLSSIYGDGYTTVLWIVDGNSAEKGLTIMPVPLGGSSGEPGGSSVEAAWWIEGSALWIARAEAKHVEYAIVAYGTAASNKPPQSAYAVVAGRFPSRDAAERRAIALLAAGNASIQTFPIRLANGPVEWVAGRLFQRQAEAQAWRHTASLPQTTTLDLSSSLVP